ncbi:MAG TPA: DUF3566 domain-containing protein [Acidimicrobiales bacterium]|jgi:hypothetical protein
MAAPTAEPATTTTPPMEPAGSDPPLGFVERRILWRIDPWSVFRVSAVFWVCLHAVGIIAGLILWAVASAAGTVDNTESVIQELFALQQFAFEPSVILRAGLLSAIIGVVSLAGGSTVLAVLYNLITEMVGGVEVTVVTKARGRAASRV